MGFEPTISAGEQPQTYALDRAATGTGRFDPGPSSSQSIAIPTELPGPHFAKWTEEIHEETQSGLSVCGPRFSSRHTDYETRVAAARQ